MINQNNNFKSTFFFRLHKLTLLTHTRFECDWFKSGIPVFVNRAHGCIKNEVFLAAIVLFHHNGVNYEKPMQFKTFHVQWSLLIGESCLANKK